MSQIDPPRYLRRAPAPRGRPHVAACLAIEATEHRLIVRGQQIIQPVDLRTRVRQTTAAAHHSVEDDAMRVSQLVQDRRNRIPESTRFAITT